MHPNLRLNHSNQALRNAIEAMFPPNGIGIGCDETRCKHPVKESPSSFTGLELATTSRALAIRWLSYRRWRELVPHADVDIGIPVSRSSRTASHWTRAERSQKTVRSGALFVTLLATLAAFVGCSCQESASPNSQQQYTLAINSLRHAVQTEQKWVKVHAAERLLQLGYADGLDAEFKQELLMHSNEPEYRIGIWRTLAVVSPQSVKREKYIGLIVDAFLDSESPDRLHALESLAKLGYQIGENSGGALASEDGNACQLERAEIEAFRVAAASDDPVMRGYAEWVLLNSARRPDEERNAEAKLRSLVEGQEDGSRVAAFALGGAAKIESDTWVALNLAWDYGQSTSSTRLSYCLPLLKHAHSFDVDDRILNETSNTLKHFVQNGVDSEKYIACTILESVGDQECAAILARTVANEEESADVRVVAASAFCRIYRRNPHSLTTVDWLVICGYASGMLMVGWYYSGRNASSDDYLVGGRQMRFWAVGISLFATLLSSISYLARPGEMIEHGPMLNSQILAYPVIILVVCYLIIPRIMRLRVWNIAHSIDYPFASDLWAASSWQAQFSQGVDAPYGFRTVGQYIKRPKFELYDIAKDPEERCNLAGDAGFKEALDDLKSTLRVRQATLEDPWVSKWTYE